MEVLLVYCTTKNSHDLNTFILNTCYLIEKYSIKLFKSGFNTLLEDLNGLKLSHIVVYLPRHLFSKFSIGCQCALLATPFIILTDFSSHQLLAICCECLHFLAGISSYCDVFRRKWEQIVLLCVCVHFINLIAETNCEFRFTSLRKSSANYNNINPTLFPENILFSFFNLFQ